MYKTFFISAASVVLAAPALQTRQLGQSQQSVAAWDAGAVTAYPIHSSCNATQTAQIAAGLNETILLARHAKDHVLRWSNSSELYRKYFGNLPPFEVIGAYDMIVNGDKGNVLFRCDNPDGNCGQKGWAGHWRGSNATGETVICPLSYTNRRWLNSICGLGYTVAEGATNTFWASDLMHRLYHMPPVGYGYIDHWVETYDDALMLAENGTMTNTHDSDVLQYFALDAYAYDVAVPGVGCTGGTASPQATTAAAAVTTTTTTSGMIATPTSSQAASQTSSAPAECHTHSDGVVHCS